MDVISYPKQIGDAGKWDTAGEYSPHVRFSGIIGDCVCQCDGCNGTVPMDSENIINITPYLCRKHCGRELLED